jgi:hypothetical protein
LEKFSIFPNTTWDEVKAEILRHPDSKFAGSETVVSPMEETGTNGGATTMGTISSSNLSFTSTSATWTTSGVKELYIVISYNWLKLPVWFLTDQIGITWDSAKFQVVDDDYDFTTTHNLGTLGSSSYVSYDAHELNSANIIGDFDLQSSQGESGTATVLLSVKPGVSAPTSTQIFYKYGHAMVVPSITLGLDSSGLGVEISPSINVDSLAKASTYTLNWTIYNVHFTHRFYNLVASFAARTFDAISRPAKQE